MNDGRVKKIMVYVDGTEGSIIAAQYGICLSKIIGAEFYVLYVINTRALNDLVTAKIFLKEEEEEYRKDIEADADRYLNHVKHLASEKGIVAKVFKSSGSINIELKNFVNEHDVDLLLIGEFSKIQSRLDQAYSESERAMRSVTCSVLIVKNEERVLGLYNQLS